MESHLQHTHGHHYDEHDALATAVHHTGHDHNEDEHHGEKKSVIKKVKEKAKKLKDTITKHGHGHGHGHGGDDHQHHDDEEDDDDDETVEDPEVHGAPMYDSARVGGLGGPDAILAQPRGNLERPSHLGDPHAILTQPRGNLERPSVMAEDRYDPRSGPEARHGALPPVSTGPYGTNLSEPGIGQSYGQEVYPQQWRAKTGQSTGMEENPFAPNPTHGTTHVSNPVGYHGQGQDVNQEGLKGSIGKSTGMLRDPDAPKDTTWAGSDPSNYETKVTNPTHAGGKETELSQIQRSFDKMGIRDNVYSSSHGQVGSDPKSFDPNHPENLPRDTLTGNPSSRSSSYAEKISSSASTLADKAADVIASKLGYPGESPSLTSGDTVTNSGSASDYAHKITDKVTGTLAPVYEKVVDAGSSIMSKVQGTVSGSGTGTGVSSETGNSIGTQTGTGHPQVQVQRGSDTSLEATKGGDVGVSVKEYLVETLRPGDEDKAFSEMITHALHRGDHEESEKKSGEDRPAMGRVTESVEVRERLGSDRSEGHSGDVHAEKGVADRLKDAVGSWLGGKGDAPQGTLGTSYVTDEGLSTSPRGDRKGGSGGGR